MNVNSYEHIGGKWSVEENSNFLEENTYDV